MKEGMKERMEGERNRGAYLRVFNKQKKYLPIKPDVSSLETEFF